MINNSKNEMTGIMESTFYFRAGATEGKTTDPMEIGEVEIVSIAYKSLAASISPDLGTNKVTITRNFVDREVVFETYNPTSNADLYNMLEQKITECKFNAKTRTITNTTADDLDIKGSEAFATLIGTGNNKVTFAGTAGTLFYGLVIPALGSVTLDQGNYSLSPTYKFKCGSVTILLASGAYGENALFYPSNPVRGMLNQACSLMARYDDEKQIIKHSYSKDFTVTIVYHRVK